MKTFSYDMIIVGGGIVGTTLACALAQQSSLSIAILESHFTHQPWSELNYHHRVSAIALSSQRIFQALQVWESIQKKRICPFAKIEVWNANGRGEINFNSEDIAQPFLGFIIENNLIQSVLKEKIKQYPQIEFISPIKLVSFRETERSVILTAENDQLFQASLAVAADGAHSWIREEAGIALDKYDYEQEAIVAMVDTAIPHQNIARQIFLGKGPLAFLPLVEKNTSSIVWSLPTDEIKRLLSLDEIAFKNELTQAFSHRLGDVLKVGQRYSFPLYKQQAKHYIKSRVVLVGDAAHTIHPLAGQGVNMGLLDAASLTEVIIEAIKSRCDFSSYATLRKYERWRKADNWAMIVGIDMIKNLFESEKKTIQVFRSMGLSVTNRLPLIKNILTRYAVGNRDDLPKLGIEIC